MKTSIAFLCLLLPLAAGLAAKDVNPPASPPVAGEPAEAPTPQSILVAQLKEIASTPGMTRKEQARLIAEAVRLAVVNTTVDIKDPDQKLKVALEFAALAGQAAPDFAEAITGAIASIPAIAGIKGVLAQVKSAVRSGTESSDAAGAEAPAAPPVPAHPEFGGNAGDTVVSPSH